MSYQHGLDHANCWRDCEIKGHEEGCYVFDCPDSAQVSRDCDLEEVA